VIDVEIEYVVAFLCALAVTYFAIVADGGEG
jgi:hypothetical protein